jgi:Ca-activated chloride channel family protein
MVKLVERVETPVMTAWFSAIHFLRPHGLWALLALPLLWALWRMRRQRQSVWRNQVDPHLLPHLLARSDRSVRGAFVGMTLAYVLAVVALAGPSWRQEEQPLWRSSAPLVLALDLSSRIGAADLPPSRLLQVRAKLAHLLRDRTGGQVALVAYAGDTFTVTPLTDDPANVALFLDDLSPEVMPIDGQRADRAIEWSGRLLKQGGYDTGDILIVTDRSDAAARDAAQAAAAQGFRVSALGLGTPAGAAYRDAEGGIRHAARDDGSLRALASAGRGKFEVLSRDDGDLRALGVLSPQASEATAGGAAGKTWRDEGYWLLLPLLLLSLFAFRRGGAAAILVVCLGLPLSMPAQAAERDWWRRPDQQQHVRIASGAEAYRKGDFAAAEKAFSDIDTATGWYNRGNALAKQGKYDDAVAAYDKALAHQPGMQDAVANRQAVEAARKRQQQDSQGQKGGGKNQKPNPGQDQSGQQSPAGAKKDQGSEGEPQNKDSPSPLPPKPEQSKSEAASNTPTAPQQDAPQQDAPQDAKSQQAADAAQRERMRQAMAGKQGEEQKGQQSTDKAVQSETAEERERRQALETWLRRVPDEPGGLLKSKFRLEYERRQREGQ